MPSPRLRQARQEQGQEQVQGQEQGQEQLPTAHCPLRTANCELPTAALPTTLQRLQVLLHVHLHATGFVLHHVPRVLQGDDAIEEP
jgi:hypothetical protein